MKLCSKLKIEIFSKDLLHKKKFKKKLVMPIKENEELVFENAKFVITEIKADKIILNYFEDNNHLHTFTLPTFKQKYFTLEELSKYDFAYSQNATDTIFQIKVEGIK